MRAALNLGGKLQRRMATMARRILDFRPNGVAGWFAELECGHAAPMRADADRGVNPWLSSPEGRHAHVGCTVVCAHCRR